MVENPWYESVFLAILRFLRIALNAILGAAITVTTFIAAFPTHGDIPITATIFIVVLLTLMVIVSVRDYGKRGDIRKFRADLDASLNALTQGLSKALENLLEELELTDTEVRATIYCHNNVSRTFVPLARYSQNPVLKKLGRRSYPEDQGVIASAWQNRAAVENFSKNDEVRVREFLKQGLPESIISGLNMKARSIIGVRLDSPLGNHASEHIGLVIIEHQVKNALSGEHMERIKKSLVFDTVRHLIHPARAQLMELTRSR